ncbi:MAG: tyrosine-type recombinase/integrase [Xanthobacteraceae bacterium]
MTLATKDIEGLPAGRHHDGGGLYLQVRVSKRTSRVNRSWLLRYMTNGKAREMGLGTWPTITLAKARQDAGKLRVQLKGVDRIDPLEVRRKQQLADRINKARQKTFKQCALEYIASKEPEWTNAKHRAQWVQSLEKYAFPVIGDLLVAEIDRTWVLRVLEPIWRTKTQTANRVRNRIELILNYATIHEYRSGDNPARWRGYLAGVRAKPSKQSPVEHFAALPYTDMSAFFAQLQQRKGIAALALAFLILTVVRAGDITGQDKGRKPGLRWDQVDCDNAVWTIPAMKTDVSLRVPLSAAALTILKEMRPLRERDSDPVFPGTDGAITDAALRAACRTVPGDWCDQRSHKRITVHGFRSTFKDWAREATSFPDDLSEVALGHKPGGATWEAYARGDLFNKRRKLMEAWDSYCTPPQEPAEVVSFPRRERSLAT